ncbi:MAG: ATP-dependent RecD-like DNA helicase [Aureispira sp.]|nr:ATP-dependent RecD-like DNA helicase [Aureispira sp.]
METIFGYIERITFQHAENGFTVAKLKQAKRIELTTIVGDMPSIQVGETVRCEGFWHNDHKHGLQFKVKTYQVQRPATVNGIKKYLGSGLIKGIGPVFAERIVKYHGEKTLEVIDTQPDELLNVDGIGAKRIKKIKECWAEQRAIREVMVFLQNFGVSPTYAQKIFKAYGNESIPKLEENPYQLAKDIYGIGFKTADGLANKMGIAQDSDRRIDAGIEFVLSTLSNDGHTCVPVDLFLENAAKLLEVDTTLVDDRLDFSVAEQRVVIDALLVEGAPKAFVWLKTFKVCEEGIARELKRLLGSSSTLKSIDTHKAVEWASKALNIDLAEGQRAAVEKSLVEKVHIITGGPGTGKSTITNVILSIHKKLTTKIRLAAPTGRAAKRMSEITKMEAKTLHSLLEFDFKIGGFKHNKENPLDIDLLVVDEASMIDTVLMYSLLKAIPDHARLILIGDVDQLPSVGAGNVLNDMINSKQLPVTRLTEIFRQAANSLIVTSAHRINQGKFPNTKIQQNGDFFFIQEEDTEKIAALIADLVAVRLPKRYGFDRFEDIQVLSPMKRGIIGTHNLNQLLQQRLNPSDLPLRKGGTTFHLHDKVMQMRNNYDKEVYNGDVGRIVKIDRVEHEVHIRFDDRVVKYGFSEMDEVVLAYAVSVHKYQGSECPCIVMPIHTTHFALLFKNLLYTGITRGKKLVVLIGTAKAIHIALKKDQTTARYTGLKSVLIAQDIGSFS